MAGTGGSQLDPEQSDVLLADAAIRVFEATRVENGLRRAIPDLLARYQRDIRRNLRVPIRVSSAESLRGLISSLLQIILEPLLDAPDEIRPFSGPDQVRSLVERGAELLDDIDEYTSVASHFFDAAVEKVRSTRPTDQVRAEVREAASMARALKAGVVSYLAELEEWLR